MVVPRAQWTVPDGVVLLDELEMVVVVDNETDTLSSVDECVPQIPELVGHAARTPPSREFDGHPCKVVFDQLCCACGDGRPDPLIKRRSSAPSHPVGTRRARSGRRTG